MTSKVKKVFLEGAITPQFIADSIARHSGKQEIGAHSIFLGQVRNDLIDGKRVLAIHYSAYEEMAENVIHEIRETAFARFPLTCLHIYHSLGSVNAGEISLFVFTSAPHRKTAIDACEEIVEKIKADVPVWGKELMEDNTQVWKNENQI